VTAFGAAVVLRIFLQVTIVSQPGPIIFMNLGNWNDCETPELLNEKLRWRKNHAL